MATVLDGKLVAEAVYQRLRDRVPNLRVTPKIVFVRVGEDPASQTYVNMKSKRAQALGAQSETIVFADNVTEKEVLSKIEALNADTTVHGVLVQLPLPAHLDEGRVLRAVAPAKDVDGLHPESMAALVTGAPGFLPCTPSGILEVLRHYEIPIEGQHVVVVGRSQIVGKPAALLFLRANATVTICHSRTRNLAEHTRQADILVAAAGKHHLIGPDHVGPNTAVIDVGIHRVEGKIQGDVDYAAVSAICRAITPVPGGVGPMTIAMLMGNLIEAASKS